ncbi:MAG TPA: urease accessory protein UreF [Dongiaceae bacterium]
MHIDAICPGRADRERGLLLLQAWLSPAFPVGGYSYSHGLEYAVEAGTLRSGADLIGWIEGMLYFGGVRSDAILLREAHRATVPDDPDRFLEIAEQAAALRGTAELALESLAQGRAFLKALRAGWPDLAAAAPIQRLTAPGVEPSYCVCFAAAAALAGIALRPAMLAYLQAFAANLISAALRLMPIGQSDGLVCLAALGERLPVIVDALEMVPFADLGSAAWGVDFCSMRHETQYTRLFRS